MGGVPAGGVLRQRGGTGTVSRNDQPFRWPRGSGGVGSADRVFSGAVRVHHGLTPVFAEDRSGGCGYHGAVFADAGQGYQDGTQVLPALLHVNYVGRWCSPAPLLVDGVGPEILSAFLSPREAM